MATIINFTQFRNDRRAAAEQAKRDQARENIIAEHMAEAKAAAINGNATAMMQHVEQAVNMQESSKKYMPAYCDPSNEFRGSKYEATKRLSTTEIAKLIRADIKEAKKRGTLPAGLKCSVKTDYFAGGSSIDIRITAVPEGQAINRPEWIEATDNGRKYNEHNETRYTEPVQNWLDTLKEIHSSYNRDNSDSMSDYFSVNFYGDVSIDWKLENTPY